MASQSLPLVSNNNTNTQLRSPKASFNMSVGNRYLLKDTIGKGTFGRVKLALDMYKHNDNYVVVKLQPRTPQMASMVKRELTILKGLTRHSGIVKLLNYIEDDSYYYLVMEHSAGGELFDKIQPDVGLDPQLTHCYFHQLISAVKYMHARGVCHRDLKPENILLDEFGSLRIADFGSAVVFRFQNMEKTLSEMVGTAPYVAPEMLQRIPYHGTTVDLWSCGIILYIFLVGNTPWDEATDHSEEFRMYKTGTLHVYQPWSTHPEIQPILRGLLTIDPQQRYTIDQIEQDPWYQQRNELLNAAANRRMDVAAKLMNDVQIKLQRTPSRAVISDASSQILTRNMEHVDAVAYDPIRFLSQPTQMPGTPSSQWANSSSQTHLSSQTYLSYPVTELGARLTRFYVGAPIRAATKRLSDSLTLSGHNNQVHMGAHKIDIKTIDRRRGILEGVIHATALREVGSPVCLISFRRKCGDPIEFRRLFLAVSKDLIDIIIEEPGLTPKQQLQSDLM